MSRHCKDMSPNLKSRPQVSLKLLKRHVNSSLVLVKLNQDINLLVSTDGHCNSLTASNADEFYSLLIWYAQESLKTCKEVSCNCPVLNCIYKEIV